MEGLLFPVVAEKGRCGYRLKKSGEIEVAGVHHTARRFLSPKAAPPIAGKAKHAARKKVAGISTDHLFGFNRWCTFRWAS
jgi:hypothetical protein